MPSCGAAGQDPHGARPIGEEVDRLDRTGRGRRASSVRWTLSASRAAVAESTSPVVALADADRRRAELLVDLLPHRALEPDPAVVAEAVGEAHDGGAARASPAPELGDGGEGGDRRVGQHDLGDAPLGRGQRGRPLLDAGRQVGHATDGTL